MDDFRHDMLILVSIAKLDAQMAACRSELGNLPQRIAEIDKRVASIEASQKEAIEHFESMAKERRLLEQQVEDHGEHVKKLKVQLMQVKTNKEYTAMQHEIAHLEREIDSKEERLLIILDELEQQKTTNDEAIEKLDGEKKTLGEEKATHQRRIEALEQDVARLAAEKPKLLKELDVTLRKRYERILAKFGDFAVTHIDHDVCQGCFARIPPQTSVEVRQNDRIITCEGCGRILVFYDA